MAVTANIDYFPKQDRSFLLEKVYFVCSRNWIFKFPRLNNVSLFWTYGKYNKNQQKQIPESVTTHLFKERKHRAVTL
jgi:hypothetical protein